MSFYIQGFWESLGYRHLRSRPKSLDWTQFHYTTKNGPNGQALWTCLSDLYILRDSKIIKDIYLVGGSRLEKVMRILIRSLPFLFGIINIPRSIRSDLKLRKLVDFPDKEGKTRIIAILDYFSQTA